MRDDRYGKRRLLTQRILWLALRTLFHEKGRPLITLTRIIFSTVLTLAQVSMYLGMLGNATGVIRHVDADIWIGGAFAGTAYRDPQ